MSEKTCKNMLLLCIFVGALYLADVLTMIFIGGMSNFVVYSSAWVRYFILFLVIISIFVLARQKKQNIQLNRFVFPSAKLLVISALLCFITSAFSFYHAYSQFLTPTTNFGHLRGTSQARVFALSIRLIFAMCILFFGVFLILLVKNRKRMVVQKSLHRNFALIGVFALCVMPIIFYSEYPFSVHRIIYVLRVCSALCALIFCIKFVGLMFSERTPAFICTLKSSGLCAFLMCTCINIPNTIIIVASGNFSVFDYATNILLIFIGLLGAVCSLTICKLQAISSNQL